MMSLLVKMCLRYSMQDTNGFNLESFTLTFIGMISKEPSMSDLLLNILILKKVVMLIGSRHSDFLI